jgi:hypothetical protein
MALVLADVGATRKAIRDALADRGISLGYRKFSGRPDELVEVEYRPMKLNAVVVIGVDAVSVATTACAGVCLV